jgi:hypothetical protein
MLSCRICGNLFERLILKGHAPQTCSEKCLKERNKLNKQLRNLKDPEKAARQRAAAVKRAKEWKTRKYGPTEPKPNFKTQGILFLNINEDFEDYDAVRIKECTYSYLEIVRRYRYKRKYGSLVGYKPLTKEQYLLKRELILFNRELKQNNYSKFYSISTRKPLRKALEPLCRPFIRRKRSVIKCIICNRDELEAEFKLRNNGKYFKSECVECLRIVSNEKTKKDVRELRDPYLKQSLKSKGIQPDEKFLNVYRALLQAKRVIRNYHEEV